MRVALVAFTTTGAAGDYVSALGTAMADRAEVSMWIPSRPHLEVPGPEIHLLDKASSRAGVAAHEVLASIGPSNLAKSISAWAPDVVHIAFGEGYPSAARVARALRGRCSVVATWHDPRPHGEPLDRVQHMVAALTMGAARGIHVHCAEVQPDDMSSQILIAEHPAFPCGSCGRSATTQPPRASGPIVFVGRFAPYKGIDQLCAALTDYWRAGGDRPLVVVGQGRAPKALRDLEERWRSLTTVVNEYVSSRDLHDVLSNASVCAMPYLSGTQSALPWLARAHGAHVVATDVGCIGEVTRRIGGRVIRAGSVTELVAALWEPPSAWTDVEGMELPTFDALAARLVEWYPGLSGE